MSNYSKPLSKTELLNAIAEESGCDRKQVRAVLDSLSNVISGHVAKGSAGVFKMPGLFKISVVDKPATEAKYGVPNPFRPGETMDVAAKPASRRVKILALKNLKDMASQSETASNKKSPARFAARGFFNAKNATFCGASASLSESRLRQDPRQPDALAPPDGYRARSIQCARSCARASPESPGLHQDQSLLAR